MAIAVGFAFPGAAAAKVHCVDGSASEARAAGSDEGPPRFTAGFFTRPMSIEASTDGLDGPKLPTTLPISIESICGLPKSLDKQAGQLAGGDGVALVTSRTSVWKDGRRLPAARKPVELGGADTVYLRGRLLVQSAWQTDEDGDPVPTFSAGRILITD
ncbi:MAG: hypothetical protein ACJ76Z_14645 [Thermoleophilaceae bacterium]